jgi:hypothetical protein
MFPSVLDTRIGEQTLPQLGEKVHETTSKAPRRGVNPNYLPQ